MRIHEGVKRPICIYIFAIILRLASYQLHYFFGNVLQFDSEIIRFGADLGLIGVGIFLGALSINPSTWFKDKNMTLLTALLLVFSCYMLSHFCYLFIVGKSIYDLRSSIFFLSYYILSFIAGLSGLCLAGILTSPISKK